MNSFAYFFKIQSPIRVCKRLGRNVCTTSLLKSVRFFLSLYRGWGGRKKTADASAKQGINYILRNMTS